MCFACADFLAEDLRHAARSDGRLRGFAKRLMQQVAFGALQAQVRRGGGGEGRGEEGGEGLARGEKGGPWDGKGGDGS